MSALEDWADRNLQHAVRLHARFQPAARLQEADGLLMLQGTLPLPLPFQNCVLRTDATVAPAALLQRAQACFGGASNPFAVITFDRPDADLEAHLAAEGFHAHSRLPAMLADAPLAPPQPHARWRIEWLERAEDLPGFVSVCARAYESLGLPPVFMPSYFADTAPLLGPDVSIAVARDTASGALAAAAMALHTGEVAGLYWVGTVPEARGAGLAAACTAWASNRALQRGALAATLQATPMGEATYRRLGFREYGRMTRWSR